VMARYGSAEWRRFSTMPGSAKSLASVIRQGRRNTASPQPSLPLTSVQPGGAIGRDRRAVAIDRLAAIESGENIVERVADRLLWARAKVLH
jgi:hypothetical protein